MVTLTVSVLKACGLILSMHAFDIDFSSFDFVLRGRLQTFDLIERAIGAIFRQKLSVRGKIGPNIVSFIVAKPRSVF